MTDILSPLDALKRKNIRHYNFVLEYIANNFNAYQACISAGFSEVSASRQSSVLLNKPAIRDAIEFCLAERAARLEIDADWLLRRMVEEVTADIADIFTDQGSLKPISQWPLIFRQGLVSGIDIHQEYAYEDGKRVPDGIVTKVKLNNRTSLLEMIGKHVNIRAFREIIDVNTRSHESYLEQLTNGDTTETRTTKH